MVIFIREKREVIFSRVVDALSNFSGGDVEGGKERTEFELPADIAFALEEQERKMEEERLKMEHIELQKKERAELEQARAKLRARWGLVQCSL